MEEVENKKDHSTTKIIILVVFLIAFAGVVFLLVNLFGEKTTITTGGSEVTSSESLYCTTNSTNIDGAFFDVSNAVNAEQAIKVLFRNNEIDNISYNATIVYENPDESDRAKSNLHVKYGKFVQENNKNIDILSPNFSNDSNKVKISLYATSDKLNSALAKIFLIDTSENVLNTYTSKVLSALYKTKGFSCEIK